MYEFWYDYVKPKYGEKAKFCYLHKDMLKLDLILEILNQIDHYQKEKIIKVIGLMKNELGGKIMTKCWTKSKNLQLLNRWR